MVAEGPRVAAAAVPVIAVLPFGNLSGDATRDYFSDGLTEDIISALGRFSGLGVIAHSSVGHLKHRPPGTRAVEAELGARYIVDGSVRDADGRLRVSVELSDAHEGRLLWSDRFEGAGSDLFDIQDRIVRNIVGALSVKITRLEQARASARPAASLEAYDLVLRARALLSRTERSANRQARELLARAQGLAPDYAGVHVVMAQAQTQRVSFGWVESPHDALSRAEDGARQALSLEDESAHSGAYALLADVANFRGDFEAALEYADRAIVLNPSDAETRHRRGMVMLYMGRVEEALASLEAAHRLNPRMNGGQGVTLALAYFLLGRYREGLAVVDEALTRFPDIAFLHAVRAAILAEVGNLDEARLAAARVRKLSPNFDAERFGTRFRDPAHTARIQEALRKARY
jgi:TolB-like protein/Tfp pilus assembly protein PilF